MNNKIFFFMVILLTGLLSFELGKFSISSKNNIQLTPFLSPTKTIVKTYPAPNDELSIMCVEDLETIKDLIYVLQDRFTKQLDMGQGQEETLNYSAITSQKFYDAEELSNKIDCPAEYSYFENLQRKLIDKYKKIHSAVFYYSKDVQNSSDIILKTGKPSSELYERYNLEKDAASSWLEQTAILKIQLSDELVKIPKRNN